MVFDWMQESGMKRTFLCRVDWLQASSLPGQADARELPARLRRKEIAIAGADMGSRRHAGTAAQNHLSAHELAVVLAQRSCERAETRIAEIGACRPLPAIAIAGLHAVRISDRTGGGSRHQPSGIQQISLQGRALGRRFPFAFGRQAAAGPARVGVSLEKTHLAYGGAGHLRQT